jgi:hypothetical protein
MVPPVQKSGVGRNPTTHSPSLSPAKATNETPQTFPAVAAIAPGQSSKLIAEPGSTPQPLPLLSQKPAPIVVEESDADVVGADGFKTYRINKQIEAGCDVYVPLPEGVLHLVELSYQDVRPLADLLFSHGSVRFRASQFTLSPWHASEKVPPHARVEGTALHGDWFSALDLEQRGLISIDREPDHNGPWIHNPLRVLVEIVYPNGKTFRVGRKFVDFSVRDAHELDGSGYTEIDNISRGYESLPSDPLPKGCRLRLRLERENRQAWEKVQAPMRLDWVKPQALPMFASRGVIHDAADFERPLHGGYSVDASRPLVAVLVTWSDQGTAQSGFVRFMGADGEEVRTPNSNIGSGETELILLHGKTAARGKVYLAGGSHLRVKRIEVLYGH